MNILDENVLASQRDLLRGWRIPFRQIAHEIGRQGMDDAEIIPLLHSLRQPTIFVRRLLRHPEFDSQAKRMGAVVRVSHVGLTLWRLHAEEETFLEWLD